MLALVQRTPKRVTDTLLWSFYPKRVSNAGCHFFGSIQISRNIAMDTWSIVLILISLCLSALLKSIFNLVYPSPKLPPGPPALPFFGNFLWLRRSFSEIEPVLRNLHAKYGPIVTLRIGSRPALFVANRSLAHQALIQNGALFADRPPAPPAGRLMSSNQHNISSAAYGPTWRLFRRNLTSQILHPSRVKSYSPARKWVLEILIDRFKSQSESGDPIRVVDHFRYAMFCLLVFMCFGNKVKENEIKEIETVLRRVILSFNRFNILNIFPKIGKVLFRKLWEELLQVRKSLEDVLIPLIRARKKEKQEKAKEDVIDHDETEFVLSYVDTLLDLELPDDDKKRKLEEGEMATLCSEFLNAGTDTTSTALEWIMANMVKCPNVQAKLVEEIKGVVGLGKEEVEEEDLEKMPYLKAVILEGLRRHPPGHFVLPHTVTQDVTLDGYVVPKHGTINFMVAEMGWDPKVWEDPMEFKPERFLAAGEVFDITGSREIKMMPFGAGRRICPGYGLAMLHLEYFVANLVWYFEWTAADGDDIDLSEKQEFTIVMKNPLRAHLSPRLKLTNN